MTHSHDAYDTSRELWLRVGADMLFNSAATCQYVSMLLSSMTQHQAG